MMIMRISYIILYRTSHPLATPHYRQAIPHDLSAKKKKEASGIMVGKEPCLINNCILKNHLCSCRVLVTKQKL